MRGWILYGGRADDSTGSSSVGLFSRSLRRAFSWYSQLSVCLMLSIRCVDRVQKDRAPPTSASFRLETDFPPSYLASHLQIILLLFSFSQTSRWTCALSRKSRAVNPEGSSTGSSPSQSRIHRFMPSPHHIYLLHSHILCQKGRPTTLPTHHPSPYFLRPA